MKAIMWPHTTLNRRQGETSIYTEEAGINHLDALSILAPEEANEKCPPCYSSSVIPQNLIPKIPSFNLFNKSNISTELKGQFG